MSGCVLMGTFPGLSIEAYIMINRRLLIYFIFINGLLLIYINHQREPVTRAFNKTLDPELNHFLDFLSTFPPDKPRAAIYFLIGRRNVIPALKLLYKHFNNQFKYPVILFHEQKSKVIANSTKQAFPFLYTHEVAFHTPTFIKLPLPDLPGCRFGIGYKHMCYFQAKRVYEMPFLKHVDYAWRLDDDSFLLKPIQYDLFKYTQKHNIIYGYLCNDVDSISCCKTFVNSSVKYCSSINVEPNICNTINLTTFYNNFEISATKFWYSKEYQDYIDYIDKVGGIYYERWGDAPIKATAVHMFLNSKQIHRFDNVSYRHATCKKE